VGGYPRRAFRGSDRRTAHQSGPRADTAAIGLPPRRPTATLAAPCHSRGHAAAGHDASQAVHRLTGIRDRREAPSGQEIGLNHTQPAEIDGRIADLEALSRNPPELKTHTQGAQPRRCSDKVCHADMGRVGTSADSTGTHSSAAIRAVAHQMADERRASVDEGRPRRLSGTSTPPRRDQP
jgi:hypothetical protein